MILYNIFEQEPQAEFFPIAQQFNVGVIVRCPFDESSLTGKLTPTTTFAPGDFRNNYFAGDRLQRTVDRAQKVRQTIGSAEPDLPTAALKFCLKPSAVSVVIPGMRNIKQVEMNCAISGQPSMSDDLEQRLRPHNWRRAMWYTGK